MFDNFFKNSHGHYSQEGLNKSFLIMAMETCWLWYVTGPRSGKASTLLSFTVTLLVEVQQGPLLRPVSPCPYPALFPISSLSLLLDSPGTVPSPSRRVSSAPSADRKGNTSIMILWSPNHAPSPSSSPATILSDPRTRTIFKR